MNDYKAGILTEGAKAYLSCCCSNASCYKNGSVSILALNWKSKSTPAYPCEIFGHYIIPMVIRTVGALLPPGQAGPRSG